MNCFLIDFENVKSTGLKGIEHLIESDDVYIFYSEYAIPSLLMFTTRLTKVMLTLNSLKVV